MVRTNRTVAVVIGVASVAGILAACAPTYTHPNKNIKREDVALDVLDCQKAAVLKYKAAKLKDGATYEERQAAAAAGRVAWDRCLKGRGWKKNE
jgi:hypothetical protein